MPQDKESPLAKIVEAVDHLEERLKQLGETRERLEVQSAQIMKLTEEKETLELTLGAARGILWKIARLVHVETHHPSPEIVYVAVENKLDTLTTANKMLVSSRDKFKSDYDAELNRHMETITTHDKKEKALIRALGVIGYLVNKHLTPDEAVQDSIGFSLITSLPTVIDEEPLEEEDEPQTTLDFGEEAESAIQTWLKALDDVREAEIEGMGGDEWRLAHPDARTLEELVKDEVDARNFMEEALRDYYEERDEKAAADLPPEESSKPDEKPAEWVPGSTAGIEQHGTYGFVCAPGSQSWVAVPNTKEAKEAVIRLKEVGWVYRVYAPAHEEKPAVPEKVAPMWRTFEVLGPDGWKETGIQNLKIGQRFCWCVDGDTKYHAVVTGAPLIDHVNEGNWTLLFKYTPSSENTFVLHRMASKPAAVIPAANAHMFNTAI